jgi:hypothetical protein
MAQTSSNGNRARLGDDVGTDGVGRPVEHVWRVEAGLDGPELDNVGVGIGAQGDPVPRQRRSAPSAAGRTTHSL